MSRAVWTRRAQADLVRIDSFNAQNDPDYADAIGRAAIKAADFLAEHPRAGPALEDGERKWLIPHTDYVLVYRIVDPGDEILRAYHGRENWLRLSS